MRSHSRYQPVIVERRAHHIRQRDIQQAEVEHAEPRVGFFNRLERLVGRGGEPCQDFQPARILGIEMTVEMVLHHPDRADRMLSEAKGNRQNLPAITEAQWREYDERGYIKLGKLLSDEDLGALLMNEMDLAIHGVV